MASSVPLLWLAGAATSNRGRDRCRCARALGQGLGATARSLERLPERTRAGPGKATELSARRSPRQRSTS
eukprot:7309369-Alexandrium_andersonii.AAC.1